MSDLASLNRLSDADARSAFLRCCGATRWADQMASRRPFITATDLFAAADAIDTALSPADWLEAFAAHPRIGDIDSLRQKFAATAAWASHEQKSVAAASEATLHDLAAGNREYEAKFGHIFIVCATGKSADEMLAILRQRMPNAPTDELRVAAAEQQKITRLRLQKMIDASPEQP